MSVLMKRPVRVLLGIAVGTELRLVLHQRDHRAIRHRLALLGSVDRGLAGIKLAVLLVVGAIDRRVEHALVEPFGKRDLVAAARTWLAKTTTPSPTSAVAIGATPKPLNICLPLEYRAQAAAAAYDSPHTQNWN
jgi:hypothetical protein